jgi:hypothetical protein
MGQSRELKTNISHSSQARRKATDAEENEAEHKDFATRLANGRDEIYFRGKAKVVV